MNGDDVAVWDTVHDPRTYGYAGDTDRANHGTRPIRHKHIHTGRRYGRVHVFQIHIWNFNAEEIQLRAGTCLAKGKPRARAIKIATHGDEPGRRVLLSEGAGAAHKGEKRNIKNPHCTAPKSSVAIVVHSEFFFLSPPNNRPRMTSTMYSPRPSAALTKQTWENSGRSSHAGTLKKSCTRLGLHPRRR